MKTQKVKKLKDFKKFAIKKGALKKVKGGIGDEDVINHGIITEDVIDG